MSYAKKSCLALVLFAVVLLSVFRTSADALTINVTKYELQYFEPIVEKKVTVYKGVKVYLGGKELSRGGYLINDTTYVPLRAASELIGGSISYDAKTRTATVTARGLSMTVSDGGYIVYANDRPLASRTPAVILADGSMYIPVRTLAKALGLSVEWQAPASVYLSGTVSPLAPASSYYDPDELLWMSRIINAESRGEPLLGKIAVGNVVLNRVRHKEYPSTVYGVIFDTKYGVQFSPIKDGSIYLPVEYESALAAKICLEGFTVSSDILFFLEPSKSVSSWIPNNRRYEFTVKNHYFYS